MATCDNIPEDHKVILDEMLNAKILAKIKSEDDEAIPTADHPLTDPPSLTEVHIANFLPEYLQRHSARNFSGVFLGTVPSTIVKGRPDRFLHGAINTNTLIGSKGAIIFWGMKDEVKCGWLLAWHTLAKGAFIHKVYMDCGKIDKFEKINWSDIESKVDQARPDVMAYWKRDPVTGVSMSVEVKVLYGYTHIAALYND